MGLTSGTRLGVYEVIASIGVGGMGEVFRARDTKLNREVALKVLPDSFAGDRDRLARFTREAQTLAALNHPYIGAIYGLEDADGVRALVLELVDGETLADRIARGSLPLNDALTIARQIAEALDAAHEKGIVHRDLKPANIMITPDGIVKVLDFGLAKAASGDATTADLTQAPTVTVGGTREGVILGTAAYMSPEQARGQTVDKRTDIWAFGCVLYEMLTGRAAFARDTITDTLAAIVEREPDWTALPAETPQPVRRLLRHCLEKDPKERLRDIADVKLIASNDASVPISSPAGAPARTNRRRTSVGILLGTAVALLAGVLLWPRPDGSSRESVRLSFEPPENVTLLRGGVGTAVSPDGRRIAFVGQGTTGATALWLRALDSEDSRRIEGTDGAIGPFWSPDGQFLGFFAQGKLKKIAVDGGLPQNICTTTPGLGATWSQSGDIVFNPTNRAPLMRVTASGGVPQPLTTLDTGRHENSHRWPSFLPDGRHFLFTARSNEQENTAVYVGSLDSNETTRLLTEQTNAVYASPGYLLFGRQGTLMAQRFDADRLALSGEAFPVFGNVDQETPSANAFFSVARDASVIAFHESSRSLDELTWFDRQGKTLGTIGAPGQYGWPRLSVDGKRMAVWMPDPESGNRDIWLIDVASGIRTRFTSHPANDWWPEWSADGASLTFASDRTSRSSVYRKAITGETEEELVRAGAVSVTNGGSIPPFAEPGGGSFDQFGMWVAYQSRKSGSQEVYVRSVDAPEEHRISVAGGAHPRLRRDGKELFYVAPDGQMMTATINLQEPFTPVSPKPLFHVCNARRSDSQNPDYDVTSDGSRFVFSCQSQETRKRAVTVAIQWLDMVKDPPPPASAVTPKAWWRKRSLNLRVPADAA